MRILIFFFLNIIFSLQAMEQNEQSNMWVSAKLLHAFLPAPEFKKLGEQVFDGGKDGKWGTIDLTINSLGYDLQALNTMCETLPEELWAYIHELCVNKDKQKQAEDDKNLINQAYVNSYAVHATFPQDIWEKSKDDKNNKKSAYTIPYNNEQGKKLKIIHKEGQGFKAKIITAKHSEIQRPNCIQKNHLLHWVQEGDLCFIVYIDDENYAPHDNDDEKSMQCIDLSTNASYDVLNDDDDWNDDTITSIENLKLDYKRNLLFCSMTRIDPYSFFGHGDMEYYKRVHACSYKRENQTLTFNVRTIEGFTSDTYMKNYDNNSGLCCINSHLCYGEPKNNIIMFVDILTRGGFKQKYDQNQKGKSFNTSCFDSDIGIFAVDDDERTAYIFKPQLDHERMATFIKTMTPYDRILVHAVLKTTNNNVVREDDPF